MRACRRDTVFSLSNAAPFERAADWAKWANCWRTTGDIGDNWDVVSRIAFSGDRWAPFAGPGHWDDPDMLVVGYVGWGPALHMTGLTPDEQYTHISMWCMQSAPLLIGCDMEKLDPFTLGLLTNDEVLAVDQDALGKQAVRVNTIGSVDVYLKELEDGSRVVGFFNRGPQVETADFDKLAGLGMPGALLARDLWSQKDLGNVEGVIRATINSHGAVPIKLTPKE